MKYKKSDFKVGQKLYRMINANECTITSIGNKYLVIDNDKRYKVEIENLVQKKMVSTLTYTTDKQKAITYIKKTDLRTSIRDKIRKLDNSLLHFNNFELSELEELEKILIKVMEEK